ncbi:hypothetical protein E2C01_021378 [Portunus trituberculatus]|uniref:Uncharacterized protein n=1 Tax=Portunus trituberculatus TaxID=210409 RepID=A0A5B7E4H7_PORTR|nr:hypothetical protein [Portunus trituberculatus]
MAVVVAELWVWFMRREGGRGGEGGAVGYEGGLVAVEGLVEEGKKKEEEEEQQVTRDRLMGKG